MTKQELIDLIVKRKLAAGITNVKCVKCHQFNRFIFMKTAG